MLQSLDRVPHPDSPQRWRHLLLVVATLLGWLLLVGAIGSLYVGRASSPYDSCSTRDGRGVACSLVRHH